MGFFHWQHYKIDYKKEVKEKKFLFSWDSVPGDDDEKFKEFLKDDFDIGWAENAEILKSGDGKIISIVKDENSAKIIIGEKKERATLKISDAITHELKVKKENGKLNIYEENKQNEYAQDHKKKAIQLTEWAYKKILKLDVSEDINERLKCQIMNNLGWYLADGGEEKDRDFSKECACYIREGIKKFPYKRKQWQDTIDQIIKTYGPVNQSELE